MKMDGRVAVVTGGAGGIGAALAERLLEHGAGVVVTDLDDVRVKEVVDRLDQVAPGRIAGVAGDCLVERDIQAVLDVAVDRFGPVDLYAANAGVGPGQGLEATEADWDTSIDVNVLAHVRAARLLIPGWVERGGGYFLTTASAAGLLAQIGSATYSVTKHAAVAFAEWLAITYGDAGVAVSCLCPMGVNTNMLNSGAASNDEMARRGAKAVTEAGGVLEPLEVADIVLAGLETEDFLILPHPEVLEYFRRKGSDYDRWIAGMRRYQKSLG
jgi:NAD(P)-dependent dehydrogenase (short-subunit alcohol dehydrogenase family)